MLRVTRGTDRDDSAGPELIANKTRIRTYKAMSWLEVHVIRCIWSLASRTTPVSRLASSRVVYVADDSYHAAEKCVCDSISQGQCSTGYQRLRSWNKKGEMEGAVSYLIGSWIITEPDIPMDAEDLAIIRVWWAVVKGGAGLTKSLAGNSGIVSSFSMIFSVRVSTNVSQSFLEAR